MLYLIKDSRGNKTLIKVGRAKDIEQRMRQYKTCNPLAKLLQVATLEKGFADDENGMEKLCHFYFREKGYKNVKGTEWYQIPKGATNYYFEDIADFILTRASVFKIKNYKENPTGNKSEILKKW